MATPISPSVQDALQTLDARVELNLLEVLAKSYGEGFVKAVEGMEAKPQIKKDDSRLLKEDVARMTRPIQDYNKALAGKVDEIVRDSFAAGKDDMEVARILRARIPEILNNEPITIQRIGKRPVSFTADEYADIVANVVPYAVRNEGYIRGLKEAGADGWQWVAVGDERMCPMCGAKHGQIYGWDDAKPPAHPGCIVEGTEIESPDGIIAGTRSKYDGLVVKLLFASGRSLSVTPNHPVLTPNGFVSANLLREGDDVLCRPNFERVLEIDPDDNQEVTTVEKVFGALLESPGVVSRAMPVSPEDFHGDAAFIYGDVDIIWSNSLLRATGKSITFEPISEDLFCPGRTENHFLSGGCILASFLNSADPSFVCNMSRLCEFCNFFRGGLGHSEVHRLAAPSRNHPARLESSSNGVSGAPELFRECLHGCSLIIASEDLTGVNVSNKRHSFTFPEFDSSSFKPFLDHRRTAPNKSSHFSRSIPGLVEIDKVVDIEVIRHSGYVYDFQSISSLLLCNGILVSNCRCRPIGWFRPRTKEDKAESDRIKAKAAEKPWESKSTGQSEFEPLNSDTYDDLKDSQIRVAKDLLKEEKKAIKSEYTLNSSYINGYLANDPEFISLSDDFKAKVAADAKNAVAAIEKFRLTEDTTVWRGIKKDIEAAMPPEALEVGKVFKNETILSTSFKSEDKALGYAKWTYLEGEKPLLAEVRLPKDTKALLTDVLIDPKAKYSYSSESEILVAPTSFRVVGFEETETARKVIWEAIIDGKPLPLVEPNVENVAEALIDDILPKKMAYPGSKIERPNLNPMRTNIDLDKSETLRLVGSGTILDDNTKFFDPVLEGLCKEQGFDGLSTVVSKDEMDKIIKEGHTELFRGLASDQKIDVDTHINGKHFTGRGMYGNGIYTAYGDGNFDEAIKYSEGNVHGGVVRLALDKDARILDLSGKEAYNLMEDYLKSDRLVSEDIEFAKRLVLSDPGKLAVARGYDAIRIEEEGYLIVLNRSAMYSQRLVYDREVVLLISRHRSLVDLYDSFSIPEEKKKLEKMIADVSKQLSQLGVDI